MASLQVWPNLKWKRRLRDEETAHKTERNESGRLVEKIETIQRSGIGEDKRDPVMTRLAAQ